MNYEGQNYDPNEDFNAHRKDFDLGYTVGGGIERKISSRWSIKVEYLYFDLGTTDRFSDVWTTGFGPSGNRYHFDAETAGHIVRAGLNFHF